LSLAENPPRVTGFRFLDGLIVKKHIRELQFCAAGLRSAPPKELRIRRRRKSWNNDSGAFKRSMRNGENLDTLRSAQVRRISWVRGVGRLITVGVASLKPLSVGRLHSPKRRASLFIFISDQKSSVSAEPSHSPGRSGPDAGNRIT
jgi:hypothetical protein